MSGLASGPLGALAGVWLAWGGRAAWPAAAASRRADPLSARAVRARLASSLLDSSWQASRASTALLASCRLTSMNNCHLEQELNATPRRGRRVQALREVLAQRKSHRRGWAPVGVSRLPSKSRAKKRLKKAKLSVFTLGDYLQTLHDKGRYEPAWLR